MDPTKPEAPLLSYTNGKPFPEPNISKKEKKESDGTEEIPEHDPNTAPIVSKKEEEEANKVDCESSKPNKPMPKEEGVLEPPNDAVPPKEEAKPKKVKKAKVPAAKAPAAKAPKAKAPAPKVPTAEA
mmetsp:Transcript_6767/g.11365  ORF Transcript_6767/g.11365 Transcript_6767/m.11365 type:complete len:127 (-) Transcript_6767:49-429(-)